VTLENYFLEAALGKAGLPSESDDPPHQSRLASPRLRDPPANAIQTFAEACHVGATRSRGLFAERVCCEASQEDWQLA